jgi:hypothetical protein
MMLTLATVLPLVAVGGFAIIRTVDDQKVQVEQGVRRTVDGLLGDIDRQIIAIEAELQVLSVSPSLQSEGLYPFYQQLHAALPLQGTAIVLLDPKGQQLLNTNRPFGTGLPPMLSKSRTTDCGRNRQIHPEIAVGSASPAWPCIVLCLGRSRAARASVKLLLASIVDEKLPEVENVAAQCLVYRCMGRRARRQADRPPHLRRSGCAVPRQLGQGGGACGPLLPSRGTAASHDPEATEQLYREIAPTFLEDKEMVEAQQKRLDEFGDQGLVDIASDANRIHMRRIVERLIVAEQSAIAAE